MQHARPHLRGEMSVKTLWAMDAVTNRFDDDIINQQDWFLDWAATRISA
jgi:hypothetical protein